MISHERRAGDRRRRPWSRRTSDRIIVRRLVGIALFLFIVNVVLGTYVVATTRKVEKNTTETTHVARRTARNTQALTLTVCTTNAAYKSALKREKTLARSAPTRQERVTHQQSVGQLQAYLEVIDPLVDCSNLNIRDPLAPRRHPVPHGNP